MRDVGGQAADRYRPVTVEVPAWVVALADSGVRAMVLLFAAAAGGFVAIGLSWAGVAARLPVYLQLPYVVSGAFGGVAVAGTFLGIANIHLERRHNAAERAYVDRVVRDVAAMSVSLPASIARVLAVRRVSSPAKLQAMVVRGSTVHLATCRMAAGRDLLLSPAGPRPRAN